MSDYIVNISAELDTSKVEQQSKELGNKGVSNHG